MTARDTAEAWGLVFDVDGVIANTEPISMEATQAVFRTYNRSQVARDDMLAYLGSTAFEYFAALSRKYAPDADVKKLIADHNRVLLREIRRSRELIFPGVRSLFVRASSDSTCRIAFATGSGRRRSEVTINACSLPIDPVKAWITGDDVSHAKPHPETYLRTAEALELPTDRCVALEDSVAGVKSAKAAGLTCVAVTNTFPADSLADADEVVASLEDVTPQMLRSLV